MGARVFRNLSTLTILALCLVTILSPRSATAQNVDWLSGDQARQLDTGFSVLVPSWIPAPFGGSPAIQANGGYYSLYWMNGGGSPTFLQITGEVGGGLPAGSPADLNNQLFINASVQGYDAIHDVTSIYDNVWWIAGGVLYTVSSNNMTGTDSLSLANSLIGLEIPAAPEPTEIATEVPTQVATEVPTQVATEVPTEVPTVVPTPTQAPVVDDGTGGSQDSFPAQNDDSAVPTETQAAVVLNDGTGGSSARVSANVPATETPVPAATQTPSNGGTNGAERSDGTAGPQLPPGSDGTGGIRQIAIP